MLKFCVLFFALFVSKIQCAPAEAASQTSASQNTLHLHINNSTDATSYHLTPIINELGNVDEEINQQFDAILPYINFLFDLFNHNSEVKEGECLDDMVIQLVPDHRDDTQVSPTSPLNDF